MHDLLCVYKSIDSRVLYNYKEISREIICMSIVSARASISLVSMSKIVGTNTPRVSRAYMLG